MHRMCNQAKSHQPGAFSWSGKPALWRGAGEGGGGGGGEGGGEWLWWAEMAASVGFQDRKNRMHIPKATVGALTLTHEALKLETWAKLLRDRVQQAVFCGTKEGAREIHAATICLAR